MFRTSGGWAGPSATKYNMGLCSADAPHTRTHKCVQVRARTHAAAYPAPLLWMGCRRRQAKWYHATFPLPFLAEKGKMRVKFVRRKEWGVGFDKNKTNRRAHHLRLFQAVKYHGLALQSRTVCTPMHNYRHFTSFLIFSKATSRTVKASSWLYWILPNGLLLLVSLPQIFPPSTPSFQHVFANHFWACKKSPLAAQPCTYYLVIPDAI